MAATVEGDELVFRYPGRLRVLRGVRLQQDARLPGDRLGFERSGVDWVLRVPRPEVDRVEYSFELQLADGSSSWVTDPDNPERVGGAFGDKSVLLLPEYVAPAWTTADPPRGARHDLWLTTRGLEHDVPAVLWSAAGIGAAAEVPLLVVHDGPEYDALAGLTLFLDAMVAQARLPPLRAALLALVDRNETYSASPT
jgi:enterochelin esterase-like enzyme